MEPLNTVNLNTPAAYDAMYYGPRRIEMRAVVPLQALLPALARGREVLDVGCGWGQYYPYLRSASAVDGIDFAPQAVEEARTMGYRTVTVRDFLTDGFPYADGSYDVVFCAEVLEHMPDPAWLIAEIHRMLRPGGIAVITTPFEDSINAKEHLWAYDDHDMRALFSAFAPVGVFRYSVGAGDMYEHFLVIAEKSE